MHCFVVGRTLEQENVDWLKEIIEQGHPVGNHTYDHVNLRGKKPRTFNIAFAALPG